MLTDQVRGKDYIVTQDWTKDEIELLLDTSGELKRQFKKKNGRGADSVRSGLQRFLYAKTRSRPVVLPSLIRV